MTRNGTAAHAAQRASRLRQQEEVADAPQQVPLRLAGLGPQRLGAQAANHALQLKLALSEQMRDRLGDLRPLLQDGLAVLSSRWQTTSVCASSVAVRGWPVIIPISPNTSPARRLATGELTPCPATRTLAAPVVRI